MHCPGLVPGLSSPGLRTPPCIYSLPGSQSHPDEGHRPPLEAVPVPWKSHRESPGGLAETPAGEEAQGEEGPAATQLDVSRLRSSSMEIREKGSEFLREELHKAQKVGMGDGDRGLPGEPRALTQSPEMSHTCQGHLHARPLLGMRAAQTKERQSLCF